MYIKWIMVRRVLVDTSSSVSVFFHETFTKLGLKNDQLRFVQTLLFGYTSDSIEGDGSITLSVKVGQYLRT